MTRDEAIRRVREAWPEYTDTVYCYTNRIELSLSEEWPLSFDVMQRLSLAFDGTKDINVVMTDGERGYSELTPGTEGHCEIVIGGLTIEVERRASFVVRHQ